MVEKKKRTFRHFYINMGEYRISLRMYLKQNEALDKYDAVKRSLSRKFKTKEDIVIDSDSIILKRFELGNEQEN